MPASSASAQPIEQADMAAARLQRVFENILQQRMQDVPIINPRLEVATVGFKNWQDTFLGILITPWFMNLILLPQSSGQWDALPELSKQTRVFPSGRYSFITGFEPDIGKYQMCSLFSPMFEFADQAAAVETAQIALQELQNADNIETPDIDSEQIQNIWNGTEVKPHDVAHQAEALDADAKQAVLEQPSLEQKLEQPISRRELLRGSLFAESKQHAPDKAKDSS